MSDLLALAERLRRALNPPPKVGDFDLDAYADDLVAGVERHRAGFLRESPTAPAPVAKPSFGARIAGPLTLFAARNVEPDAALTAAALPARLRRVLALATDMPWREGIWVWAIVNRPQAPEMTEARVRADAEDLVRRGLVSVRREPDDTFDRIVPTALGRRVAAAMTAGKVPHDATA